jgi:hypothetical protein
MNVNKIQTVVNVIVVCGMLGELIEEMEHANKI